MSDRERISFPALDGLRALCFFSVFFFHGFYTERPELRGSASWSTVKFTLFGNGDLGVNVFFVLSGFLITYLLIAEKQATGKIHVPRFWLRRVLRIWPLYFTCVAIGFIAFPLIKRALGGTPAETADPLYYLLFLSNFDVLAKGIPDASILSVLWSIAVEEQFYLLWPVVLALVPRRWYPWCFALIIAQSWGYRATHDVEMQHEMHTLSCIGDMAIGGLGAYLAHTARGRTWIGRWNIGGIVALHALFLVLFLFRDEWLLGTMFLRTIERSIIALLAAAIIAYQAFGRPSFLKLSGAGPLGYLGRISYGLYCLHMVGILAAVQILKKVTLDVQLWQVMLLQPLLAFGITVSLAALSYRFFERPFLQLKNRFAYVTRG